MMLQNRIPASCASTCAHGLPRTPAPRPALSVRSRGAHHTSCICASCRGPAQSVATASTASLATPSSALTPKRAAALTHRTSQRRSTAPLSATTHMGGLTAAPGMKFGIVVARFNSLVTKQLLEGALEDFERHGVASENIDIAWVPGSFELPVVASSMARSGQYQAIVCIGTVIQGSTAHYDAVVGAATNGVLNSGLQTGTPVIFGVLTTDNLEQALDRAGGKLGNKGGEAAMTAIEMATLMRDLESKGKVAKVKQ